MALRAGHWLTAMAVEHLSGYFADSVEMGVGKWSNKLKNLTASQEIRAIEGERERSSSANETTLCSPPCTGNSSLRHHTDNRGADASFGRWARPTS